MQPKITTTYQINTSTLAILPASAIEYQAIVQETMQEVYVQQTTIEIIKTNCLSGAASYHGRRRAASQLIGSTHKVPILIYDRFHIYAFPTQSPNNFACSWLFAQHIDKITQHPQAKRQHKQSTITFRNGATLDLEESPYQLQAQFKRTLQLHYAIKDTNLQPTK